MVSGRGYATNFNIIFLVEIYFCGNELMKTDGTAIIAELWAIRKVWLEKMCPVVQ